jgi:hypothetical protein
MRILACPVLGYFVVKGEFEWATGLLIACGFSDWVSLDYIRIWLSGSFRCIIVNTAGRMDRETIQYALGFRHDSGSSR